ncbi:MAG: hypothetical protein ACI855_004885, partial [Myxococcota bacterium]
LHRRTGQQLEYVVYVLQGGCELEKWKSSACRPLSLAHPCAAQSVV